MNLIRRNTDFFPAFFDDFFGKESFGNEMRWASQPAVNVIEKDKDFIVELAAPGMKKDDFHVQLDDQMLTISYEKSEEKEDKDEDGRYTKREFNFTNFSRSFMLPKSVVKEGIVGKYKDGLLTLQIPKTEESKARLTRNIEIK
jgi:HSP20 family protein